MFLKKQEPNQNADIEFFTIFDSKSQSYALPTFSPNKNTMIREVINMFREPDQAKNKYLVNAEDYSIFKIGTYDKATGQISVQNLEHVANMHDLRAIAAPQQNTSGIVPT